MEQAAGRRGKSKKAKKKVGSVSGSGGQMMAQRKVFNNYMTDK